MARAFSLKTPSVRGRSSLLRIAIVSAVGFPVSLAMSIDAGAVPDSVPPARDSIPTIEGTQSDKTGKQNAQPGVNHAPAEGRLPGGTVPGGTLPGGTLPGGTVPGGPVPGGTLPGGTVPGGTLPGGTLPGGTVPGGTLPSQTLPGEDG